LPGRATPRGYTGVEDGRYREEGLLIRYGDTDVLYFCMALLVG
jgi:hypothetical protein